MDKDIICLAYPIGSVTTKVFALRTKSTAVYVINETRRLASLGMPLSSLSILATELLSKTCVLHTYGTN